MENLSIAKNKLDLFTSFAKILCEDRLVLVPSVLVNDFCEFLRVCGIIPSGGAFSASGSSQYLYI